MSYFDKKTLKSALKLHLFVYRAKSLQVAFGKFDADEDSLKWESQPIDLAQEDIVPACAICHKNVQHYNLPLFECRIVSESKTGEKTCCDLNLCQDCMTVTQILNAVDDVGSISWFQYVLSWFDWRSKEEKQSFFSSFHSFFTERSEQPPEKAFVECQDPQKSFEKLFNLLNIPSNQNIAEISY